MRTAWWTSRSNCLVYALKRWFSKSGYLVVRKSNFGWWPHFLWTPDINGAPIEHYAPIAGKRKLMPPPLFKGAVQRSDKISEKAPSSSGYAKVESLLFILFCLIVGSFGLIGALLAVTIIIPIYKVVQFLAAKANRKNVIVETPPSSQLQAQTIAVEPVLIAPQLVPQFQPVVTAPESIASRRESFPQSGAAVSIAMIPQPEMSSSWTIKTEKSDRALLRSGNKYTIDYEYYGRERNEVVLH